MTFVKTKETKASRPGKTQGNLDNSNQGQAMDSNYAHRGCRAT